MAKGGLSSLINSAILIQDAKDRRDGESEIMELIKLRNILFYMACARGSKKETRRLLSIADVNFVNKDDKGRTPLLVASRNGHLEIVDMLYDNFADENARDDQGDTALNAATDHNHLTLASWLFEKGVDFDAGGEDGRRALFKAVYNCNNLMVKLLLEKGADINKHRDDDGSTLLHAAVTKGDPVMLEELLGIGADVYALDSYGQTPLQLASTIGCRSFEKMLSEKEAEYKKANANIGNKRGCSSLNKGTKLKNSVSVRKRSPK
jgi:ankyrin repeat protein